MLTSAEEEKKQRRLNHLGQLIVYNSQLLTSNNDCIFQVENQLEINKHVIRIFKTVYMT